MSEPLLVAKTYRLVGPLGAGSMGEVFDAEHVRLGKRMAVKLLRQPVSDPRTLRRFLHEARALASIESEFVVGVIDCGVAAHDTAYLVMERLLGADLRQILSIEGSLAVLRALRIALDASRGLSAIHAAGLVHRDLKPANLFISRRANGEELCKILDLGVAKTFSSEMTEQGAIIGTVRYMAPEQLVDGSSVTPKSDIYALGAILYESLAGRPPHAADSIQELMFQILNRDPRPLSESCPNLPPRLERLVMRALARNGDLRPESAEVLERELTQILTSLNSLCQTRETVSDDTSQDGISVVANTNGSRRAATIALRSTAMVGLLAGAMFIGRATSRIQSPEATPARYAPALQEPQQPRGDASFDARRVVKSERVEPAVSATLLGPQETSKAISSDVQPAAAQVPLHGVQRARGERRSAADFRAGVFDSVNPYD